MMRVARIVCLCCLLLAAWSGKAQEIPTESRDSILVITADSVTTAVIQAGKALPLPVVADAFKPNPTRAVLYGLVPGLGQIYNRKYWKLPIIYGGLMGCYYAIRWNNVNYNDYKQAYFDIMSSDPDTNNSWQDFIPGGVSESEFDRWKNDTSFHRRLKLSKDRFRRYRDMSIIITAGVYLIFMLDAYVDAQLFDFDISPDLSMRVQPEYVPKSRYGPQSYGVNCSFTF
ncbi:DUF5683 domain-containing protein [Parabacteroides sp. OttesenSCG-928-N08]|nr:DUF5683 domain-containing protein [Parabacteroides sp. OttesenSCG-928-N08]